VLIGVDFDNTIVCYDGLFHQAAVERGLISADVPASKGAVRDYLRRASQEDLWTELQGYVYGPRMCDAKPFPGVLRFFERCSREGLPVTIISHRTRWPYLGEKYDLHQSARDWLAAYGFHDPAKIALPVGNVYLESSKQEKVDRIAAVGCTHFIDDLPEFLTEPAFPTAAKKILFDPNALHADGAATLRVASWSEIERLLLPMPTASQS
jgi:hypothetical protein